MKKLVAVLLLCGGCVNPNAQAELDTFNAVAPEYRAYVEADPLLTPEGKQLRFDTIETWRRRTEITR